MPHQPLDYTSPMKYDHGNGQPIARGMDSPWRTRALEETPRVSWCMPIPPLAQVVETAIYVNCGNDNNPQSGGLAASARRAALSKEVKGRA